MINTRLDDPACRALAMHFYPTASPAHIGHLARLVQDVAMEFGRLRLLPERPTPPKESGSRALLDRLIHRIRLAEIAYADALQAAYPIGTPTTYVRKGSPRRVVCTVVGHSEDQIRVRGRSGAEYYVRATQMAPPSSSALETSSHLTLRTPI